jgi:hypothetical protein
MSVFLLFSTPSLVKKSHLNENGSKLKSVISSQNAGSEDNTNVWSAGGAKPLLQSFINQVLSLMVLMLKECVVHVSAKRFKQVHKE